MTTYNNLIAAVMILADALRGISMNTPAWDFVYHAKANLIKQAENVLRNGEAS